MDLPEPWGGVALFVASVACARARRSCSCLETHTKEFVFNMPCCVSSPGKVLLTGGYLVLEPENIGIPIAASARFYASVSLRTNTGSHTSSNCLDISVISPQFYSIFEYTYDCKNMDLKLKSVQGNDFVAKCLSLVMLFAKEWYGAETFTQLMTELSGQGALAVKLQADNDFYSHIKELQRMNKPLLSSSLESIPRLSPCHRDEKTGEVEVSKTGMGSSAALTTSLVGALLHAFGIVDIGAAGFQNTRRIVHNLSQLAHCIAQGKIGSGFDVSAAVYGSQIYSRFDPKKFNLDEVGSSGSSLFAAVMDRARWTQSAEPFSLPPGLGLMMADVCGGSSSSSMARGVLAWRAKEPEVAAPIWDGLATANIAVKDAVVMLHELSQKHKSAYSAVIDYATTCTLNATGAADKHVPAFGRIVGSAAAGPAEEIWSALISLKAKFGTARALLREMGKLSGQDIEPLQQQELADATEALPGVLCAGVPGAGGVDAMYAIVFSGQSRVARDGVEAVWSTWSAGAADRPVVCALTLDAENGKSGVMLEDQCALYY